MAQTYAMILTKNLHRTPANPGDRTNASGYHIYDLIAGAMLIPGDSYRYTVRARFGNEHELPDDPTKIDVYMAEFFRFRLPKPWLYHDQLSADTAAYEIAQRRMQYLLTRNPRWNRHTHEWEMDPAPDASDLEML